MTTVGPLASIKSEAGFHTKTTVPEPPLEDGLRGLPESIASYAMGALKPEMTGDPDWQLPIPMASNGTSRTLELSGLGRKGGTYAGAYDGSRTF
jgi:hypothetical protein